MNFGSLFSGIGGLDLGLERAGMTCKWQVEIDEFCRRVLEKHWPNVKRYGDIREVGNELEPVDLICGGFPCQDVSIIGKRRGLDGDRSGLWREFARIVRIVRPRFIVVENVPGLLSSGFGRVLGDLAESGYDAEWQVFNAGGFGVPQQRRRLFVVGYLRAIAPVRALFHEEYPAVVQGRTREENFRTSRQFSLPLRAESVKHGNLPVLVSLCGNPSSCSNSQGVRATDGLSRRLDVVRYKALGNAVVWQIPERIGRRILEYDRGSKI